MDLKKLVYSQGVHHILQNISRTFWITVCKPSLYILKTTYNCNLRCKHCSRWKTKYTDEMSTKKWKKIIFECGIFKKFVEEELMKVAIKSFKAKIYISLLNLINLLA